MRHKLWTILLASMAAGLLGIACGEEATPTPTTKAVSEFEQFLQKVRQEEQYLVFATQRPARPENRKAIQDAFNKRFGLNVRIDWDSRHPDTVGPQMVTEVKAGRATSADILTHSMDDVVQFLDEDMVEDFDWVGTFGKELPRIKGRLEGIPPKVTGKLLHYEDSLYGIAYNTTLIDEADVPDTLAGLAEPKHKGNFAYMTVSAVPFSHMTDMLGEADMEELTKNIMANEPFMLRGSSGIANSVGIGESAMGILSLSSAWAVKNEGMPVNIKATKNIGGFTRGMTVFKQSRHPNLAHLFAAWVTTEGEEFLFKEASGVVFSPDSTAPMIKEIMRQNPSAKFIYKDTLKGLRETVTFNTYLLETYWPHTK